MILLGKKLRALRENKYLTLKQTGELLGIAVSTVSSYESDTRRPPYETLIRYVDIFNTSADFILGTRNQIKDNLSRLNYEHRKIIDEFVEFLISKEQNS